MTPHSLQPDYIILNTRACQIEVYSKFMIEVSIYCRQGGLGGPPRELQSHGGTGSGQEGGAEIPCIRIG